MRSAFLLTAFSAPLFAWYSLAGQHLNQSVIVSALPDQSNLLTKSGTTTDANRSPIPNKQPDLPVLVIPAGEDLRLAISKGCRLTGKGERVTATLTQPVYVGQILAVPRGTLVSGYVSDVFAQNKRVRIGRLLNGDITPPKTATISFDRFTLETGEVVPFLSESSFGQSSTKTSTYLSKQDRPSLKAEATQQVKEAIRQSNKLQKLSEAAITSLPYHPEYIDEGTVYNTVLTQPLMVPDHQPEKLSTAEKQAGMYLHLRLLTAVNSETAGSGASVSAILSEPFYNSSNQLIYPVGLRVNGTISRSTAAGWLKRQGSMQFAFNAIEMPDSTTYRLDAVLSGIQASQGQDISIDLEGGLHANLSRIKQVSASLSLIGPSTGLADNSTVKTGLAREGEGRKGFGFLGAGAAQASAGTAVGLGYFGAAKKIYGAFIAKGENVVLPEGTPLVLRLQTPDSLVFMSSVPKLPEVPSIHP